MAALSLITAGNSGANPVALTFTTGTPHRRTARAIFGFSIRAMMPSPRQLFSQRGGSLPRPCSDK